MTENWVGITVAGEKLVIVHAEVPDTGPLTIVIDRTIELAKGDRAKGYVTIHKQVADYLAEKKIGRAVIKESALSLSGTKKSHLLSAELRGVVMCACASVCMTTQVSKAKVSKTFGDRKADEYLSDNSFWDDSIEGQLRVGSREAVLNILAARSK